MGRRPGCYLHIPTHLDTVCPSQNHLSPAPGSAQDDGKSPRCWLVSKTSNKQTQPVSRNPTFDGVFDTDHQLKYTTSCNGNRLCLMV